VAKVNVTDCPELRALRLAQGMVIETFVTEAQNKGALVLGERYVLGVIVIGPKTEV